MARFARYSRYGGPEVIELVEEEPRLPGPGELRVRVAAAGINPVDYKIFGSPEGAARYEGTLPSGVGHDYAGVVDALGEGVEGFAIGEAVLGGLRHFGMADYVLQPADGVVIRKPDALSFEQAGALAVVGRTAWAIVRAVGIGPGDTVFVSAAAGGVGVLAVQLARRAGARVVGTAGPGNHDFLRGLGVTPVAYGDGLVERLRNAAPQGYTAALDTHGPESIDAALGLGVPIERLNTIAARGHRGAQGAGSWDASNADFAEVARLVAEGELLLPIDSVYPFERVREAYAHLIAGHVRGKVVVTMGS